MNQLYIKEFIIQYLPWVLSFLTLLANYLAGYKHKDTWKLSIFNQFLWLGWIIISGNYGFIPMNIGLWIIFIKNHLQWKSDHQLNNAENILSERNRILDILNLELLMLPYNEHRLIISNWLVKIKERIHNEQ